MITLFQYNTLYGAVCKAVEGMKPDTALSSAQADFYWHFLRPYVCVIHEPTGRGYYLDRNYDHIISVRNIIRPGSQEGHPMLTRVIRHETEQCHRAASHTTPEWAEQLPIIEFTTYWLY